jgi:hypothetical protein
LTRWRGHFQFSEKPKANHEEHEAHEEFRGLVEQVKWRLSVTTDCTGFGGDIFIHSVASVNSVAN